MRVCAAFSSDNAVEVVMRTIKEGDCYFMAKPLRHEEVRNIWIHVMKWRRERGSEVDDPDDGGSDGSQQGSNEIQGASDMFLTDGQPSFCLFVVAASYTHA